MQAAIITTYFAGTWFICGQITEQSVGLFCKNCIDTENR